MSVRIDLTCEMHPRYRALRPPMTKKDCVCSLIYIIIHEPWRLTGFQKAPLFSVLRDDEVED